MECKCVLIREGVYMCQEEEGAEKWSVLRDDFMMGANMKDWDKEDNDEDGGDDNNDEQYNSDSSG